MNKTMVFIFFFAEPKEIQDARPKVDETVQPRAKTKEELLREELDEMKAQLSKLSKKGGAKGKAKGKAKEEAPAAETKTNS